MAQMNLLVVDDDKLIHETFKLSVPENWKLTCVTNLSQINSRAMFHAAFVDMHLQGDNNPAEGPQVIAKLSEKYPQLEITGMSGDLSLHLMESCLKNGARRFLGKPLSSEEIKSVLEKVEALWLMRSLESHGRYGDLQLIGQSPAAQNLRSQIAALRGEGGPILIEGESGTGKEVVSKLINRQESQRPFIAVNIASIPEQLFESELFGHIKGAFTGAEQTKIGLAEAAHGGDLFLDEIEAMPLTQQVKLLRFLETGEVRKVGSKEAIHVKTRVIVATNQKLEDLVKANLFREDLLWRISGKKITLPPLRERSEDITLLADYFLSQEKPRRNKSFAPEAYSALQSYKWPGNIRELKRMCEQLSLKSPLPIIRAVDVENLLNPSLDSKPVPLSIDLKKGLNVLLTEYETEVFKHCLAMHSDPEDASRILGISKSTFYKKLKDLNIPAQA